jgi:hypothetical protein
MSSKILNTQLNTKKYFGKKKSMYQKNNNFEPINQQNLISMFN